MFILHFYASKKLFFAVELPFGPSECIGKPVHNRIVPLNHRSDSGRFNLRNGSHLPSEESVLNSQASEGYSALGGVLNVTPGQRHPIAGYPRAAQRRTLVRRPGPGVPGNLDHASLDWHRTAVRPALPDTRYSGDCRLAENSPWPLSLSRSESWKRRVPRWPSSARQTARFFRIFNHQHSYFIWC